MAEIKVITIEENESFLRQVSKEVDVNDKDLKDEILILEQYCLENDVLAMAAVQLGIPKRLIYVKNTNLELVRKYRANSETEEDKKHNEAKVLINPVITLREGLTDYWEGCASCLDNMGHVKRPYKIKVEYDDLEGIKHIEEFTGFAATVLSHEMDHLDGILHMDIADEIIVMTREESKAWSQEHDYHIISKTGDYEELNKTTKLELIKKN